MLAHDQHTETKSSTGEKAREVDAVVVGAGLSGICAGVTLKRAGVDEFVILTKESEFGGTWQKNIYPGVACDIPSQLYSFGFHPNPGWSRMFAPGKEIHDYLLDVVDSYALRPHARFGTEMLDAGWDDQSRRWLVRTTTGSYSARFLILGTGSHHATNLPEIPGIEDFQGRIFHSSDWPSGYDGSGDRVVILGTGASSIQITPAIARGARHVTVLQRTPAWILPKVDWAHSRFEQAMFRRVPGAARLMRAVQWLGSEIFLASVFFPRFADCVSLAARANLALHVRDRRLRRALTPDYTLGCKRALVSNDFYRALNRPDVDLVASAAGEIRPRSVVAADGTEIEADTIVLATGFHFVDSPIYGRIRDRDGIALADRWKGHPRAYRGTTVSGCPNLFVLWGPNSGSSSAFVLVEAQCRYIADALRTMRRGKIASVEVRLDVETAWKDDADRVTSRSVQNTGGCSTYYLDATGHNGAIWPGSMTNLWRTMKRFDASSYHLVGHGTSSPATSVADHGLQQPRESARQRLKFAAFSSYGVLLNAVNRRHEVKDALMKASGRAHTAVYKATRGRLGSSPGAPALLLTVPGRKTGQPRTTPLFYLPDADRCVVVASKAGDDRDPSWYLNLMKAGHATVQVRAETTQMYAKLATAEERTALWPQLVRNCPSLSDYQTRTEREFPVVILHPHGRVSVP